MSSEADSTLLIGVGHAERQDDGVGPFIAQDLRRRGLPAVTHEGDGSGLLDLWDGRRVAVVIDAISDGTAPGMVSVFTAFEDSIFANTAFVHSTHRIGVPEAISLGKALGRLPGRLVVIGIGGAAFGFGAALSPPVATAAERLIAQLAGAEDMFDEATIAALRQS